MINGISTKSSDLIMGKDAHSQSGLPLSEKNQTDDAKVVKTISTSTTGKVIAGESINNLSETTGSIIALLLKDGADLIKTLAPFFSESVDIFPLEKYGTALHSKENILNLKNLIFSLSLKSDNPDHEFIPRLLEKSGLLFEKKVSDLLRREVFNTEKTDFKKITSLFKNDVTDTEFKKIADQDLKASIIKLMGGSKLESNNVSHSIKNFSEIIEKFQILNLHSSESGRYLIPFPVFFNGSFNFGQLFFNLGNTDKGEKQKKQRRVIKVSLLLTMSELGPLRVDMALFRKEISGMIRVADEETLTFVREMIPELKIGLNKHDFHVLSMDCEVAAKEKINNTVFLYDILQDEDQGLNIVI